MAEGTQDEAGLQALGKELYALVEELYVAAKRAEVITLSATHMVPDPKLNLARELVQIDFFREHLGPPAGP